MTALSRAGALLAAVASVSCGARLMNLPDGAGSPAPDGVRAYSEALQACERVATLTAEIAVGGSVGGRRLRARLLAGFSATSARLEAVAPFGAPFFILVATHNEATLLLQRDNRVLARAPTDAVLEAIAGIRLQPAELKRTLLGCHVPEGLDRGGEITGVGDNWRIASGANNAKVYLRREGGSAPWRIVAVLHPDLGSLQPDWRAEYRDFREELPHAIRLVSGEGDRFDLQIQLSQLETNGVLTEDVFRVQIPASAEPITLDQLRQSGPLGMSSQADGR
jgi:hypothetical protein